MSSVRRRPRDRKAQIARAAADAFSASGFHAVSMDDIAARVGISAAALYRHAAGKYELFRVSVLALSRQLVDCTAFADDLSSDGDPVVVRDRLVVALIDTAMANRTSGGLYRWEGRYLLGDDQALLAEHLKLVNRRLQVPLNRLRPGLTGRERWTLSAAALSVIGSIADHRAPLGITQIRTVLFGLATAVLDTDLPVIAAAHAPTERGSISAGRYEALLRESLRLFHNQGYRETSVEDIAGSVGMPASGIYRYFAGKADILAASFRRAADRVSADVANTLAAENDPVQALDRLIDAYVEESFANPELAYLYYTERAHLPAADERILRNIQRATVESWAQLVLEVRPEFGAAEARFAVHAAFALVVDVGRLVGYDDSTQSRVRVRALMTTALFGLTRNTPGKIPACERITVNLSP